MKRLLFLAAGLGAGGAERQITTVACLMKKEGYEVTMYCWNDENFFDMVLTDNRIPIRREVANGIRRLWNVRRFIRRNHFDAVISFLPTPNFCNEVAAIGGRTWKLVIGERSSRIKKPQTVKEHIFDYFRKYADIQVCNSENARRMLSIVSPRDSSKLRTIYNAVSIGDITDGYIPLKDHKLHVVIMASMYKTKNPLGLLDAVELMTEMELAGLVIDWYGKTYAAIGDDAEYRKFSKRIREHALENVVVLHSATTDVVNTIQRADVVALFSELEGLPNAICEGMMVGKPIIMTRVSDYSVLVDQDNGLLCDWDDPESIKDALLEAASFSIGTLVRMGRSSKEKAERLFSSESIAKAWVRVIESQGDE